MKVRMLTSLAGVDEKSGESYAYVEDEEYDLPTKRAKELLARSQAEPVGQKRAARAETR